MTIDPLSILIFGPALGALVVAAMPPNKVIVRWVALIISLIFAGLAIAIFREYTMTATNGGYILEVQSEWFAAVGASWHLGIDGVSATMVLLTGLLVPLAILISWEIDE